MAKLRKLLDPLHLWNISGAQHAHPISSPVAPPAPSTLAGISLPETEWDCPSHVPQHHPEPTHAVPNGGLWGAPASQFRDEAPRAHLG